MIQTDFARQLCLNLANPKSEDIDTAEVFNDYLHHFCRRTFSQTPSVGFLSLILNNEVGEFWYGFTTPSFGVGYFSASDKRPTAFVDRLSQVSQKFRIFGMLI